MSSPGQNLRALREQLGYTLRDVELASARIAARHKDEEFSVPLSRLSDIETKNILPSIYRIYSLAAIYRVDMREILAWYGADCSEMAADSTLAEPPRTHPAESLKAISRAKVPVRLDPSFDLRKTTNFGRMIEKWDVVPLTLIGELANSDYTYAYIGTEDYTMYPLLMPGTFLQVDESRNHVADGSWRSEYERPIYFVETRDGYTCCWCAIKGEAIILQPHPLSPSPLRVLRHPQEAEVIGQVVGIAMRLDQLSLPAARQPEPKVPPRLN